MLVHDRKVIGVLTADEHIVPGFRGTEDHAKVILNIRDHYESLLASERSKVIAEVREWAEQTEEMASWACDPNDWGVKTRDLNRKLDSIEADKEWNG